MDDGTLSSLIIGVPCALFVFFIICIFASNLLFKFSEPNYLYVHRQCRFLDALSRDIKLVNRSVEQIRKRANRFGGSELDNLEGVNQLLSRIDLNHWLIQAENVSWSAKRHCDDFEAILGTRKFLNMLLADFINLLPAIDNAINLKKTAKKIDDHARNQQELAGGMCELLEQTRDRIRSLQDRPIGRTANEFLGPKMVIEPKVTFALERLTGLGQNSIRGKLADELRLTVIKVKLVQALVMDLRYLRLESEIEKAWASQALEIIEHAEQSVFAACAEEERMVRLPLALGLRNWMAKLKIRSRINYFDREYSELLKAKDRYGFGFLRRETTKHVRRRLQWTTGDRDVPAIAASIRSQLPNKREGSHLSRRVTLLCEQLEKLDKVLKDQSESEGAIYARAACFDVLKKTALDAEDCVREDISKSRFSLHNIDRIQAALDLLQKMVRVCSVRVRKESCFAVGFEEDVHELVSTLTAIANDQTAKDLTVISIVGTQGIGKTTLVKEVLNDYSLIPCFKARLVTFRHEGFGSDSEETKLLENVGNQILQTQERDSNKDYWIGKIRDFLKNQSCLLVLDNLPSKKAWDTIKQAFPSDSKTVVMVTTSSTEVASHANNDPKRTHLIRLRTDEESWEFFTQMAKFPSDADEKTKSLWKKAVARTGGLPIAILHLGYLLSGKTLNEEELTRVQDHEHFARDQWSWTWKVNKEDFQSRPVLSKCFSYSEFFPADFDIPSRRLVSLWEASGSVQSEESEHFKQVGHTLALKCLKDMVGRNMIQVVERKRNGDIKTCRFPSALREIWLRDTRNKAARARSWSLLSCFNRQLAYRFDEPEASTARSVHGLNSNVVLQEEMYPRSIMFFDTQDGNKPGEDIGNFLVKGITSSHRRFKDLLVLDLEGVFRPHLPSSIGKLKNLTYLGLRWTFLETLPDSIGNMSQLQTLDLKHTYVQTLPPSTWKLKTLRHLYLNQHCRIKLMPKQSSSSMKNLQTLSGVFLDYEGSALCNGFDKLQSLQKLGVTISHLPEKPRDWLAKGIAQLAQLRSLSLRSIDENGKPQDLHLKSLSSLTKLSKLYLLGKLVNQTILNDLPKSLTELTLSASELSEDPMRKLGKLSELKFLSLLPNSYLSTHMVCNTDDFPGLLVLQVWGLPNLEKLKVKPGSMPKLREFEIRHCTNLNTSIGLPNLKTLQELKLTNMASHEQVIENEFAAVKENSSQKIIHCPRITKKIRKLLHQEAKAAFH